LTYWLQRMEKPDTRHSPTRRPDHDPGGSDPNLALWPFPGLCAQGGDRAGAGGVTDPGPSGPTLSEVGQEVSLASSPYLVVDLAALVQDITRAPTSGAAGDARGQSAPGGYRAPYPVLGPVFGLPHSTCSKRKLI